MRSDSSAEVEEVVRKWPRTWALWAFAFLFLWHGFSASSQYVLYLPTVTYGDGIDYENIAFHLVAGEGFWIDNQNPAWQAPYLNTIYQPLPSQPRDLASTGRPPLYPVVISACYFIGGRGPLGFALVRIFNLLCLAVAGTVSVWLTARVLLVGCAVGVRTESNRIRQLKILVGVACCLTLLLQATHQTLASYANDFLTEPFALCLMQLFLGCMILATTEFKPRWLILSGLLLGMMILCRSVFIVWLPGIAFLSLCAWRGQQVPWSRVLGRTAALMGIGLLLCLPWWIHNCVVLQAWMPLGTQGPITLIGGYSDSALRAHGEWQLEPELQLRARLKSSESFWKLPNDTAREVVVAQAAKDQLWDWISNHREDLPSMAFGRVWTHWNPYWGKSLLWKLAAMAGLIFVLLRSPGYRIWMLGLPVLSTLVVAALYSVGGRFLVPLYGLLFTLASVGVVGTAYEIMQRWLNRKPKTVEP